MNTIRLYPKDRIQWSRRLDKYAGKILFERNHAYVSTNSDYIQRQYKWGKIWDIMLHSLFTEFPHNKQNTKEYRDRLNELDQHMFDVLRFIYQAPLLHYTHLFGGGCGNKEMETQKTECFILKSSNNHFYMGEYIPHLYLVVRSPHNLEASFIYDLTETKNDGNCMTYGDYKIYLD